MCNVRDNVSCSSMYHQGNRRLPPEVVVVVAVALLLRSLERVFRTNGKSFVIFIRSGPLSSLPLVLVLVLALVVLVVVILFILAFSHLDWPLRPFSRLLMTSRLFSNFEQYVRT